MQRTRRPLALLAVLLGAVCAAHAEPPGGPAPVSGAPPPEQEPEHVVLLHGLGRSAASMQPLARHLAEAGFRVHNLAYPSTEAEPEALVAHVTREIAACCARARVLHLVGHSLGGILARAWLAQDPAPEPAPRARRLVLLAPPNRGSELVDTFGESALFRWLLGPTATRLGTGEESLPNRLPPPPPGVEIGVVAGTDTVNPLGSAVLPDEDDGMVTLDSTKLPGMADHVTLPVSHAFIMASDEVAAQVVHFLRHGRFDHADAGPDAGDSSGMLTP